MDIVRQVELRCRGHRLAAEYFSALDNGFKLTATIVSALAASASVWGIVQNIPIVNYILAGATTITTIVNGIITVKNTQATASAHKSVAKMLDSIRITYVSQLLDTPIDDPKREDLVYKMRIEISSILKDAPLLDSRFETAAQKDVDHRDEKSMSTPMSPRNRAALALSRSATHSDMEHDNMEVKHLSVKDYMKEPRTSRTPEALTPERPIPPEHVRLVLG